MVEDAFYKPYYEWCQKHNMQNGHDNQMREAEPIDAQRTYVDYFRTGRWYSAPGHEQTSDTRVQASISHLYGRQRVWQEGFWGAGWGQTIEELTNEIDRFYVHGSNLYNPHAWYYSTHGSWWEWAPPCTSFRQPYWVHYKYLADYVSRMSYLLSAGDHVSDIAVLYPEASLQGDLTLDGRCSAIAETIKNEWRTIVKGLDGDKRDYDWIDEDSIQRAICENGRIKVAQEEYRVLILPTMTIMRTATARRIEEFCKSGGTVIKTGQGPSGSTEKGLDDAEMRQSFDAMKNMPSFITVNDSKAMLDHLGKFLERDCTPEVQSLHRRIEGKDFYFVLPPTNKPQDAVFRTRGVPELWDPYTGKILPVPQYSITDSGTKVRLDYAPSPAYFIVIDPTSKTPAKHEITQQEARTVILPLSEEWDFQTVPTMDNRWGDFALPASTSPLPIEARQFKWAEEPSGGQGVSDWKMPEFDDSKWSQTIYSSAPYWAMAGPYKGSGPEVFDTEFAAESSDSTTDWRPVFYSRLIGIDKDPANGRGNHGPKMKVYPDFVCLGTNPDWTTFYLKTSVYSPVEDAVVETGYPFAKKVWVNDELVLQQGIQSPAIYASKVKLHKGWNKILIKIIQSKSGNQEDMRVSFSVSEISNPTPKWIWQKNMSGETAFFRKEITLPSKPESAHITITADNGFELYVNGIFMGKKAGIDTATWQNAEKFEIPLHKGLNVIAAKGINLGGIAGLLANGRIKLNDQESRNFFTDKDWLVSTEGTSGWHDLHMQGTWTESTVVAEYAHSVWGSVYGMDFDPDSTKSESPRMPIFDMPGVLYDSNPDVTAATWYRFNVPPGTRKIHLSMTVPSELYLDGKRQIINPIDGTVKLKSVAVRGGLCAIRAATKPGVRAGAAFSAPVRFDCVPGKIKQGSWHEKGLPHYSGMGIYKQIIDVPATYIGNPVSINLGTVRGTAEVLVNGKSAGVRLWSPFQFDLTDLIKEGKNKLEIKLTNTLGPHYLLGQPAHYVYEGQQISGLTDRVSLQVRLPTEK